VDRILFKKERRKQKYLLPRRHRWKELDGNVVQPGINPTKQAKLILQLNLVFRVLDTHLISRGVLGAHGNLSPVRLATGLILFNTMHLATNLLGIIPSMGKYTIEKSQPSRKITHLCPIIKRWRKIQIMNRNKDGQA